MTDPAAEHPHWHADRPAEQGRPPEDHDHLHYRRARSWRRRHDGPKEGGQRPGLPVAESAPASVVGRGEALLCQHLRRPVQVLLRVPRKHASSCDHTTHWQVRSEKKV